MLMITQIPSQYTSVACFDFVVCSLQTEWTLDQFEDVMWDEDKNK